MRCLDKKIGIRQASILELRTMWNNMENADNQMKENIVAILKGKSYNETEFIKRTRKRRKNYLNRQKKECLS